MEYGVADLAYEFNLFVAYQKMTSETQYFYRYFLQVWWYKLRVFYRITKECMVIMNTGSRSWHHPDRTRFPICKTSLFPLSAVSGKKLGCGP